MPLRVLPVLATILTICFTATAQTRDANASPAKTGSTTKSTEKKTAKSARELEAERLLKEKRANAQSLLINLAADARSFNDAITRGRTLARVANVLWDVDRERAQTIFRLAWDAAEVAEKQEREALRTVTYKPDSGPGLGYPSPSGSDNEKAASLVELAIAEARRISGSDVQAPRAFVAAANAMFAVNPTAVWETMNEAVKSANSAEDFTGEDGELSFRLATKAGPSHLSYNAVPDFDLDGIFRNLADYDYDKAVQLARGLNRDAPRSVATIAIARTVLETKKK